ncbi:hypothetical protein [Prescottella equi]
MSNYLRLYYQAPPSDAARFLSHRLPPNANLEAVRKTLSAAQPGEAVEVQIVFQDQLHEQTLHIRPSMWAAWLIHDVEEADS